MQSPFILSAETLIGNSVKDPTGESLGEIKNIMLDVLHGRIVYAVLSFGGFLGLGDKLFAVPWDAMILDLDDQCFVLNVDKETLRNASGFDKDNWPDFADPRFHEVTHAHFGVIPYWSVPTP